ncbi:hypothetical protein SAMN04489729_6989 [Amycolatopsis lurida]|nr:hypothetical protein [Amycolatopsis lurida]SEE29673.1 hypothetical protein SAMN04489729_6989 [Amycolatopsis lurida]
MDFTTLLPTLRPRGEQLDSDAELAKLMEQDERWDDEGVEEIESYEAGGLATAAFRAPSGLVVGVREFRHTEEQKKRGDELVEKYRAEGIELVMPLANIVGQGDDAETVAVYGGYDTEDSAVQDARRILLESVIDRDVFSQAAGWNTEVVVLARGVDAFTIFRTHVDERVDVTMVENVLWAYAQYAEAVDALATDLTSHKRIRDFPPMTPKIIDAWLRRESAQALAGQARVSLDGALRAFSYQPSMSVADLARSLHTDRGNLSRLISKAAKG